MPLNKSFQKLKLGFTPSETDFWLLPKINQLDAICLVAKDTIEADWVKQFLPVKKILFYTLKKKIGCLETVDYDEIFANSDLAERLKQAGLKNLWLVSNVDNMDFLSRWSKKNGLKIITANFSWQKKIENKIWFDQFLTKNNLPKPASQVFNYGKNSKINLSDQIVLQEAMTAGGEGTYFIAGKNEIKKLLLQKKISPQKDYLLREFISGKPYGITVFVAPNKIYLSQIRLQCYWPGKNQVKYFLGVQWLENRLLQPEARREINQVFSRAGKIFSQMGAYGFANFDFILSPQNKVYILECNPRFSAATGQLVRFSGLNSKINILDTFLNPAKTGSKIKAFKLGRENFKGSALELNWQPKFKGDKLTVSKVYPLGIYKYRSGKICFQNPDIRKFSRRSEEFIFLSLIAPGDKLKEHCSLGRVLANFPIYDLNGKLNGRGRKILNYFKFDYAGKKL